jgi:serine/threonine protein kinase
VLCTGVLAEQKTSSNLVLRPQSEQYHGCRDGIAYLTNFGIARFFQIGQAYRIVSIVSPGYATPEQYGQKQTTA